MKFKTHMLLLALLLCNAIGLKGQTHYHLECGFVEGNQNQNMSFSTLSTPAYSGSVDPVYLASFPKITFNIYFWIVTRNDGTAYRVITKEQVAEQLNKVNELFLPMGICFVFQGMDLIKNDGIFTAGTSYYAVSGYASSNGYVKSNCLNVYVHPDLPEGNGITSYGSNRIGVDSWVTVKPYGDKLLAHEIAHTFGLSHVWGSNNTGATTDERVTRNQTDPNYNALTAGDKVHDTPAMTSFWGEADARDLPIDSIVDTANCLYIGIRKDPQGTPFSLTPVDVGNPMGYTYNSCIQGFTTGQGIRIREYIDGSPTELSVLAKRAINSAITLSNPETNKSFIYQYESVITVNNNYSVALEQDINLKAGDYIALEPNIDIKEGSLFVAEIQRYECHYDQEGAFRKSNNEEDGLASPFDGITPLRLYPNPNNGTFDITLAKEIKGNINIEIYDLSGKVIYRDSKQGTTLNINVPNLSSGMYIVHLSSGEYNETIKFVKN